MHPQLQALLRAAEENYLDAASIEQVRVHLASLGDRLQLYKRLRDLELELLQSVCRPLVAELAEEEPRQIERAIRHSAGVLRYCAMALLLDSPEFLEHRLLEWLMPQIQAHHLETLMGRLLEALAKRLQDWLSPQQWQLLHPFLARSQAYLAPNTIVV